MKNSIPFLFLALLTSCDEPNCQSCSEQEQEFIDKMLETHPNLDKEMPLALPHQEIKYSCGTKQCYCTAGTWEGIWDCILMGRERCKGNKILCVGTSCGCNLPTYLD